MDMRSAGRRTAADPIASAAQAPHSDGAPDSQPTGAAPMPLTPQQALDVRELQQLLRVQVPPKPAALKPSPLQPTALEPATPEPTAPDPTAPQPAAPKPTTPKPAAPKPAAPEEAARPTPDTGQTPKVASRFPRRIGKAVAGATLVAVFGIVPFRTLMQISSVEAVVNARVVTLRAPIEGEVSALPANLARSGIVPQGTPLLDVVDHRADRGRLDELQRQNGHLSSERMALDGKLAAARTLGADLDRQANLFRQGRIAQLGARSAELQNMIAVAGAQKEEAVAARNRAAALSRTGAVSSADLDRLTRAAVVATQTEAATRNRLAAADVELKAAHDGVYIGDSYNDRPSSVQRAEEVRQQIAGWTAERMGLEAEADRLARDMAEEQERYRIRADAAMSFPVAGRIWEVMVSPGEQVRVGQDLVRVLDCSTTLVTANVTETVYNQLRMGSTARFLPSDGGGALAGAVVALTGQAGAPANLAIEPAALSKEPYRVTVAVPTLDAQQACGIGRTGRVVFGDPAADASP